MGYPKSSFASVGLKPSNTMMNGNMNGSQNLLPQSMKSTQNPKFNGRFYEPMITAESSPIVTGQIDFPVLKNHHDKSFARTSSPKMVSTIEVLNNSAWNTNSDVLSLI